MHQTILAQRRAAAAERINERGRALVEHLELEPDLADRLKPVGVKELAVADMMRLEAIADLIDQIAQNAGVKAAPVTAVTVNEFIAPQAPAEEPAAEEAGAADRTEDLPAPTDEEEPEKKSTRKAPSTRARTSKKRS